MLLSIFFCEERAKVGCNSRKGEEVSIFTRGVENPWENSALCSCWVERAAQFAAQGDLSGAVCLRWPVATSHWILLQKATVNRLLCCVKTLNGLKKGGKPTNIYSWELLKASLRGRSGVKWLERSPLALLGCGIEKRSAGTWELGKEISLCWNLCMANRARLEQNISGFKCELK